MKILSILILLVLIYTGSTYGQSISEAVSKVRQIKLLESTRHDVKKLLHGYDATDDEGYYQEFSKQGLTIEITYSSGICSDEPDDEDVPGTWNVREWTVVRIEISPEDAVRADAIGQDFSKFKKEPRWPDDSDAWVFHNKVAGIAVKTNADGIEKLIVFPPRASRGKLCRNSSAARGFYTRKGWFSYEEPYDFICRLKNIPANVQELNLSASEIDATSIFPISVVTVAIDVENDLLTYSYTVSAGKITGRGSSVEWDLSGVSPGTYSITVGVDDGAGIVGTTKTKMIIIR